MLTLHGDYGIGCEKHPCTWHSNCEGCRNMPESGLQVKAMIDVEPFDVTEAVLKEYCEDESPTRLC
jgi:hypothetical protein